MSKLIAIHFESSVEESIELLKSLDPYIDAVYDAEYFLPIEKQGQALGYIYHAALNDSEFEVMKDSVPFDYYVYEDEFVIDESIQGAEYTVE